MTSQSSISADKNNNIKFFFETLKNSWTHAVTYFVIFFLAGPVLLLTMANSYTETIYREQNTAGFLRSLGECYSFVYFISIVIAVFCAIFMFSYLNSRSNVNFYHSLPFKRTRLFFINFFAGIVVFLIPFALNLLICSIIPVVTGMGFAEPFMILLSIFGNSFLYFLMFYTLTVMIGMLTGYAPVQWALTMLALCLIPAVKTENLLLAEFFSSEFNIDYYFNAKEYFYTTPVVSLFYNEPLMLKVKILFSVCILIFTAAAVVLYNYRLSERSGNSFVYNKFASVMKYVVMFPCALGFALIFGYIGNQELVWLLFGGAVGSFIGWTITNSVINKTAKAMFKNVKGFAIFTLAVLIYIPALAFGSDYVFENFINESTAKSISIDIGGNGELATVEFKDKENKKAIIAFIEKYQHGELMQESSVYSYIISSDGPRADYREIYPSDYDPNQIWLNGKTYYIGGSRNKRVELVARDYLGNEYARRYFWYSSLDNAVEEMRVLADSEELSTELYKKLTDIDENHAFVIDIAPNMIKDGKIYQTEGNDRLPVNTYGRIYYGDPRYDFGFIEAYKQDIAKLSYDTLNSPSIGSIQIECRDGYGEFSYISLPITMNFINTIEYFADSGIINSVNYADDFAGAIGDIYVYDKQTDKYITVSDDEEKAEIISACGTGASGSGDDSFFVSYEDRYRVIFEYDITEHETRTYYYGTDSDGYYEDKIDETIHHRSSNLMFLKGRVPSFIDHAF